MGRVGSKQRVVLVALLFILCSIFAAATGNRFSRFNDLLISCTYDHIDMHSSHIVATCFIYSSYYADAICFWNCTSERRIQLLGRDSDRSTPAPLSWLDLISVWRLHLVHICPFGSIWYLMSGFRSIRISSIVIGARCFLSWSTLTSKRYNWLWQKTFLYYSSFFMVHMAHYRVVLKFLPFLWPAAARSLQTTAIGEEKNHGNALFIPKEEGLAPDADDFTSMDYTPARKKPPIHNRRW